MEEKFDRLNSFGRTIRLKNCMKLYVPAERIIERKSLKGASGEFTKEGIEKLIVNSDEIVKTSKRINANKQIAEFYDNYFKTWGLRSDKGKNVASCFTSFDIDYYVKQGIKDIKRVILCHDKFCINCQAQLSKHRYAKYSPILDEYLKDYKIFHVVFTVPNCSGFMLKATLDKMTASFSQFIRYFQSKKIKDIDFFKYGFFGGIRALEITLSEKNGSSEFHPHFHCLFLFENYFDNGHRTVNKYSFKRSEFKKDRKVKCDEESKQKIRKFDDFEILLQKVWYLIYNGIRVNKENIDNLKLGYSCYAQRVASKYHEVFKYCMKGLYDTKTGSFLYKQETFNYLYEAMHRRKVIQGYGALNKFKFMDDVEVFELEDYYFKRIIALRQIEDPVELHITLDKLIKEIKDLDIKFISKNSVYTSYVKDKYKVKESEL